MNRCIAPGAYAAAFALAAFAAPATHAQTFSATGIVREAPKNVVAALMGISTPPVITMDGKADRLSPGARIRDTNNMLVLPASLAGKNVPVVYRRDTAGLVSEAWILTGDEYAKLSGTTGLFGNATDFVNVLASIFAARR